jgi:hypothetical protein
MRAPRLLLVGLCALPFVLVACDDDDSSSADEDQITATITRTVTSGDPATCTETQTAKFTQQTSGEQVDTPEEAVKSCQQEAADDVVGDEVEVTDIEVDGDTATAQADVTGGFFGGQTLDLALVKEGDQWKLDEFKGFVDFDGEAQIANVKEALSSEPDSNPQAVDCVVGQFQKLSDEDLESIYVGNNPELEDQTFEPCSKYFQG